MRRSKNNGHSLLEMILACMIFVSVVVVMTSVWIWYGRTVAASRYVLVGSQLGEEVIDQCVAAGYDRVDILATGDPGREIVLRTTMRDQVIEVTYSCKVTVEETSPLKHVLVEVAWEDKLGPEVIRFETLLFKQD